VIPGCWRRKASRINIARGPGKDARTASPFQVELTSANREGLFEG